MRADGTVAARHTRCLASTVRGLGFRGFIEREQFIGRFANRAAPANGLADNEPSALNTHHDPSSRIHFAWVVPIDAARVDIGKGPAAEIHEERLAGEGDAVKLVDVVCPAARQIDQVTPFGRAGPCLRNTPIDAFASTAAAVPTVR